LRTEANASVPIIVEAIMNKEYSSIQEMLLRACWENGLDYSKYLPTFVNCYSWKFYECIEAFTVIENMEQAIDEILQTKWQVFYLML
jgi:hypothetical protein